jgi:hypothetical protein
MPGLKKIDCSASEKVVLNGLPTKSSVMCKNGNFHCRWREKIVDVSQFLQIFLTAKIPKNKIDVFQGR